MTRRGELSLIQIRESRFLNWDCRGVGMTRGKDGLRFDFTAHDANLVKEQPEKARGEIFVRVLREFSRKTVFIM